MTLAKDVKQGEVIRKLFKVDKPVAEDPNDDKSPLIFTITTDVRDRDGDIVDPAGIMVENYKNNAVMQWAHKYDDLPVGKSVEMWAQPIKVMKAGKEVTQQGVKAAVEFQPDDNYHESFSGLRGSMVRRMYMTGFLNAVSIGFDPYNWNEIEEKDEERQESPMNDLFGNGTHFTKWDLLEFSAVPVPANPQAVIDRAATFGHDKAMVKAFLKEMSDYCTEEHCALKETKGVIPYKQTPKADPDATWSGPEQVAEAEIPDLQVMCTWKADKPPADLVKGDFKLPHHTAKGHQLVKAGLVGCGNAIQGARGGVNIPSGDIPGVKSHLAKHYKEFDMTPPWEPKPESAAYTSVQNTAIQASNVNSNSITTPAEVSTNWYGDSAVAWGWTSPTKEEENVNKEIEDLKKMVEDQQKQINELSETLKAGRVLSAANESDLRDAVTSHNSGVKLTNGVLAQVTGKPGAGPKPAPAGPEPDTPPDDDGKSVTEPVIDVAYPLGHEVAELKDAIPDVPEPVVATENTDEEMIIISEEELETLIQEAYDEKAKELGLDDELAANAS